MLTPSIVETRSHHSPDPAHCRCSDSAASDLLDRPTNYWRVSIRTGPVGTYEGYLDGSGQGQPFSLVAGLQSLFGSSDATYRVECMAGRKDPLDIQTHSQIISIKITNGNNPEIRFDANFRHNGVDSLGWRKTPSVFCSD